MAAIICMKDVLGCLAEYGTTKSMFAPYLAKARAIFKQATPNPPLLCGGNSQPSISIFIIFYFSIFL